jgi:nonribosomal peptide synthetase DhbF
MWITGDGVAEGYLGRPELTSQHFVTRDIAGTVARWYRSGDLAVALPNGDLDYRGRNDEQVKLHGFRIELGEIEAVLLRHPSVQAAAAAVQWVNGRSGEGFLTAIVVFRRGAEHETTGTLRRHCAERLPSYMVPNRFLTHASLPLAPSGKLDRRAVLELAATLQQRVTRSGSTNGLR